MAQHAELAGTRQGFAGAGCGHAEKTHQDRNRLERIGDREAAIEDAQRQGADVGRAAPVERSQRWCLACQLGDHRVGAGA